MEDSEEFIKEFRRDPDLDAKIPDKISALLRVFSTVVRSIGPVIKCNRMKTHSNDFSIITEKFLLNVSK